MKNLFSNNVSKKKLAIIITSLLVLVVALGFFINQVTKKTVTVNLDGEKSIVKTHANTVEDIFGDLDIPLREEDYVKPALGTKIENNLQIEWIPAKQVQIIKDNEEKIVWTTAKTVEELLDEQKIQLKENDEVEPALDQKLKKEEVVHIEIAFPVKLIVANEKKELWSTSTTVADFLSNEGITLNELDRVEPELDETLQENAVVNVVRVEKVTDVVEEPLDFAVVTKKDARLTKGKEKVVEQGQKGLVKKKYEVVLENGKEVSRKLLSEKKVKDKQDKVVAVGTKNISRQVSRGAKPAAKGKELYVTSTAYTPKCNGCSGYTATGLNIAANPNIKLIAVDPTVIPLGTKVYVDGYGYAIAGDTGSSIKGYKIDVLFPTKSEAYRWGRKKVKIKIIN